MNECIRQNRVVIAFALLLSGAVTGLAPAAEPVYPARPVRFIIPSAPGGGMDSLARILSPKLGEAMGQPWIVDNRSGATSNLGAEIATRANPDGHTVLMALSTQLTANPHLFKLPFSVEKDLRPITMLAIAEHILVVHPSVPAKTLKEFIAVAKQKPGTLHYASAGVGSSLHLAAELLKVRAGIDMVHVPYKAGGLAAAAVLAGESQVITGTISSTIQFITAGRLRALASTEARRSKVLPDLPTVAESGYPGFEAGAWYALYVPSGISNAIAERIRNETIKALQHPEVITAMTRQGLNPETSTPAELAARVKREAAMWGDVIKQAKISVQ